MRKISKNRYQTSTWSGKFGKLYIGRNYFNPYELDKVYRKNYGVTRTELNKLFIGRLNHNIRVLEVGANVGNQLLLLQKMGFKNLYGIEINSCAVELSKQRTKNIHIIQGSVLDIPFKDKYFDLVFSSGLLIHIHPKDIEKAIMEIYRCSNKYIWGHEYYSEKYQNVLYRGNKNLLWKADFPKIYADTFPNLKILKLKYLKYLENNNLDVMFLFRKKSG